MRYNGRMRNTTWLVVDQDKQGVLLAHPSGAYARVDLPGKISVVTAHVDPSALPVDISPLRKIAATMQASANSAT